MANTDRTCPSCAGLVTQGEEFCPTCGEWLGIEGGVESEEFGLSAESMDDEATTAPPASYASAQEAQSTRCPLCGTDNPPNNRHCEQCGARLQTGQLPVAPQPMIQTTAAMRTALIAGGLLVAVVVIAFVVNALRGEDTPEVTDTTLTSTTVPASAEVVINDVTCSAEYPTAHPCGNLIDGTEADWNAPVPAAGETLTITMEFVNPTAISFVVIENLAEGERFRRNYRPRAVRLSTSDVSTPFSKTLDDLPGPLTPIDFRTQGSVSLTIEIVSTFPSESIGEGEDVQPGFEDLSIAEITVYGTPAG